MSRFFGQSRPPSRLHVVDLHQGSFDRRKRFQDPMAFSQTILFFHLFDFATILLYYYIRLKSNKPVCKRKFLTFTPCPNFNTPSIAPASTARCKVTQCKNSAHETVLSLDIVAYEHSSLATHIRLRELKLLTLEHRRFLFDVTFF